MLAVLACFDLLRYRDRLRLDVALLFGSLALIIIVLTQESTVQPAWLEGLGAAAIVAQPYLLLRLLSYFNPVPAPIQRAALAGMLISWSLLLVIPPTLTPVFRWIAVVYFILVEGYASMSFIRGAQTAQGITRWRLNCAAVGTGLLGLAIWLASIAFVVELPNLTNLLEPISLVILLASAILYYVAFNPPYPLRQTWQHAELLHFLEEISAQPARKRARGMLDLLCATALRTTGGIASAVTLWSEAHRRLMLVPQDKFPTLIGPLDIYEGIAGQAWSRGEAVVADKADEYGAECARLAQSVNASVIVAIPISAPDHIYGLLLVFHQRRSLFINTDISLLTLLAQQTALSLEYEAVLIEQDGLIKSLKQTASRNKALDGLSQSMAELTFDKRAILDTVVVRTAHSLGDGAIIHLATQAGPGLKPVAIHHPRLDIPPGLPLGADTISPNGWPGEQVVQSGQPLLIAEISPEALHLWDAPNEVAPLESIQVHSLLSMPLKIKRQVIGTLTVWRDSPGHPYNDDDRMFLQIVADRTAVALDNAELTEELEERVVARTFELETANRDLRAFAHTVAHEVKNPLTQIVGFAQLIIMEQGEVLNETAQHCLNMIVQGAEKMSGIITSLLLLANIREHQVALEPLVMPGIIEEACQRLMPQIQATNAQVTLASDWPPVQGYAAWIEEVWVNYLSNALKYGGRPPRIELGWEAVDETAVKFWVQDSGPGIPPNHQHRLFAPFVRLQTNGMEGHGLGLSIVRRIVEKCGGEVGVESEGQPDKGTMFWFTLRRVLPSASR